MEQTSEVVIFRYKKHDPQRSLGPFEKSRCRQKRRLLVVDKSLDFGALFPQDGDEMSTMSDMFWTSVVLEVKMWVLDFKLKEIIIWN